MEIKKAWLPVRHVVTMKCQWRGKIPHYRHSFLFHQDCKGRRQEVKPHSLIVANLFVWKEKDFSQESTWCVCITTFSASLLLSITSPIRPISTWNKTGHYSLFCQSKFWTCLSFFLIFHQPGPPEVGSPWKVEVLAFSCWLLHQYHPCLSPELWMAKLCRVLWINSDRKYFKFNKIDLTLDFPRKLRTTICFIFLENPFRTLSCESRGPSFFLHFSSFERSLIFSSRRSFVWISWETLNNEKSGNFQCHSYLDTNVFFISKDAIFSQIALPTLQVLSTLLLALVCNYTLMVWYIGTYIYIYSFNVCFHRA